MQLRSSNNSEEKKITTIIRSYNDHGRVHAKIVTLNSLKIMSLLQEVSIQPHVVKEKIGELEDAKLVITVAGFLHDLGMSITREDHENNSVQIGDQPKMHYLK